MLRGNKDKALKYINTAIEIDNKYSKMADEEPVFIPIKVGIKFNSGKEKYASNLTENEIRVQRYLEKTYQLSGQISKIDINLARVSKEDLEANRKMDKEQLEKEE